MIIVKIKFKLNKYRKRSINKNKIKSKLNNSNLRYRMILDIYKTRYNIKNKNRYSFKKNRNK